MVALLVSMFWCCLIWHGGVKLMVGVELWLMGLWMRLRGLMSGVVLEFLDGSLIWNVRAGELSASRLMNVAAWAGELLRLMSVLVGSVSLLGVLLLRCMQDMIGRVLLRRVIRKFGLVVLIVVSAVVDLGSILVNRTLLCVVYVRLIWMRWFTGVLRLARRQSRLLLMWMKAHEVLGALMIPIGVLTAAWLLVAVSGQT